MRERESQGRFIGSDAPHPGTNTSDDKFHMCRPALTLSEPPTAVAEL